MCGRSERRRHRIPSGCRNRSERPRIPVIEGRTFLEQVIIDYHWESDLFLVDRGSVLGTGAEWLDGEDQSLLRLAGVPNRCSRRLNISAANGAGPRHSPSFQRNCLSVDPSSALTSNSMSLLRNAST